MKQISNTLLKVLGNRKRMQNINKTCEVVGGPQSFQFFRQNTSFLKSNRTLPFKLDFALLNNLLIKKISPYKPILY